jgi:chemotaxis family two-component system response regulator PixH
MTQKTILIVEDDKDTQWMLKKRLQSYGFQCHSAFDISTALEMLQKINPDLVLLDLGFGWGPNGSAFLTCVQQWLPKGSTLPPILVMSGFHEQDIIDYVLSNGAQAFIPKPIDKGQLISTINKFIGDSASSC